MAAPASAQTPPHQVAREQADQAARLGERDEDAQQYQRPVGLLPAHQSLGATQLARTDVDDRLIIGNELAGAQRALDFGHRIVGRPA